MSRISDNHLTSPPKNRSGMGCISDNHLTSPPKNQSGMGCPDVVYSGKELASFCEKSSCSFPVSCRWHRNPVVSYVEHRCCSQTGVTSLGKLAFSCLCTEVWILSSFDLCVSVIYVQVDLLLLICKPRSLLLFLLPSVYPRFLHFKSLCLGHPNSSLDSGFPGFRISILWLVNVHICVLGP